MREIKKQKTKLVHLIEQTWRKTDRGKNIQTQEEWGIVLAICGTLFYLDISDFIRNEQQKEYFIKSRLSTYSNMTNVQLAIQYNLCVDTVSSYCTKHMEVFEKCLKVSKELINLFIFDDVENFLIKVVGFLVQNRNK